MKTSKPPLRREGSGSLVVSEKHTDNVEAVRTGIFFILATVLAIKGLGLSNPILTNQDFLIQRTAHSIQIVSGAVVESILVCTACGMGSLLAVN